MPIYSKNRSGSLGTSMLEANRNYKDTDMGRIMYESCVNDKAIFDYIINSDKNEIRKLREGTLLESEIKSMNEFSVSDILRTLATKLDELWKKIKGAFDSIITKLSAYLTGDAVAFAKMYKSTKEKYKEKGGTYSHEFNGVPVNVDLDIAKGLNFDDLFNAYMNKTEEIDKADVIAAELGKLANSSGAAASKDPVNTEAYAELIKRLSFKDKTVVRIGSTEEGEMLKILEKGKETISTLKTTQDSLNRAINGAKVVIKSKLGTGDNAEANVAKINMLTSAFESVVSTVATVSINIARTRVKNSRTILQALLSGMKKEASQHESFIETFIELDRAFNYELSESEKVEARRYAESV